MRSINESSRGTTQRGVSLIEVLVATFITVLGVLGAASLQLNSVKFNHVANTRSHATMLAYDAIDRMRANRGPALAGQYDIKLTDDAPNGNSFTEQDLREWLTEVGSRLPAGDASIEVDGQDVVVTVQWDESRISDTREENAADMASFRFESRL